MRQARKSLDELTSADLELSPVWTVALDGPSVEPHAYRGELDADAGAFVVRAKFRLANGTFADGYVTPAGLDADVSASKPVIVTPLGQVEFWWGTNEKTRDEVAELYRRLGTASPSAAFPIYFLSVVPLKGSAVSGQILGFTLLTDFRKMTTRIVR